MRGFFGSFLPFFSALRKFLLEIAILSLAFLIGIISIVLYVHDYRSLPTQTKSADIIPVPTKQILISVDIAGSIENPGTYEATSGSRLKDILILAGGLSANADRAFVSRNLNLAKFVTDQEKIYIPSYAEISAGIFTEPQKTIDVNGSVRVVSGDFSDKKININAATLEELDTLPGVGKITAENIIQNRPYKNIDELLTKKVLKKTVYDDIKNHITD